MLRKVVVWSVFWLRVILSVSPAFSTSCPSTLVLLYGTQFADFAYTLLNQRLADGGVALVYAETAQEVIEQFVVQFHEVITNTRSGKMHFSYQLQGSGFSERQVAKSYKGIIDATEKFDASRSRVTYSTNTLTAREYSEFQKQTGYIHADYGEETEYQNWYNQLATESEQRMFWDTLKKWNAHIIVFATLDVLPIGSYGGIYSCRAVVSVRVIDARNEPPCVLKSSAVVANGVDLSLDGAAQRVVQAVMERVTSNLAGVIPCYTYQPPLVSQFPLGAIGFAVLDFQSDWATREVADRTRTFVEAAVSKYPEIALYTRKDLEKILTEQRLGLTGLVENPVEVSRLAGVRYIFTGSITEYEYHDQDYYIDFPILNYLRLTVRSMRVGLSLSLTDVQTGKIIWSAEKCRSAWGFSILGLEFNMSPLDQFRQIATEVVREFYATCLKA